MMTNETDTQRIERLKNETDVQRRDRRLLIEAFEPLMEAKELLEQLSDEGKSQLSGDPVALVHQVLRSFNRKSKSRASTHLEIEEES